MQSGVDAFISYSHKDKLIVDAMVHYLEENKCRCWYAPRDIDPGVEYAQAITAAIPRASFCVFVLSVNSIRSKFCHKEVDCALNRNKVIIPFRIEECKLENGFELYLGDLHWIDAFPEPERQFSELLKRIGPSMGMGDRNAEKFPATPADKVISNADAAKRKAIDRFVKWYARWVHESYMRLVRDVDHPVHADLLKAIEKQFQGVGERIDSFAQQTPSMDRFLSVCDALADLIAISYDNNDISVTFSKWIGIALAALAQNPKGARGTYSESEVGRLSRGASEIMRLMSDLYIPLFDAAESCGLEFHLPLGLPRISGELEGMERAKALLFRKYGEEYTFNKGFFDLLSTNLGFAHEQFIHAPVDLPVAVEFDEELLQLQFLATFSPEGEMETDVGAQLANLERNKILLNANMSNVIKRLAVQYEGAFK